MNKLLEKYKLHLESLISEITSKEATPESMVELGRLYQELRSIEIFKKSNCIPDE